MKLAQKLILIVALCSSSMFVYSQKLTVNVHGVKELKGHLVIELMNKSTYEDDVENSPKYIATILVTKHKQEHTFIDLSEGDYAVLVYHDLNSNNDLDFSVFSGPEEPVGASNNAVSSFGLPDWEDVKVSILKSHKLIDITLND